ncbi:hypothetical protein BDN70DRAFT_684340 [Pholiota conissans]|uniref:Uncharacterized protein n=1 Tax=Pholiota conissans TaxID=109636 RepID=A0A9P5YJQ3_9AGAR|nr:hypothetical protein BDN70DRAFT_684340 [Pholiota conissans]
MSPSSSIAPCTQCYAQTASNGSLIASAVPKHLPHSIPQTYIALSNSSTNPRSRSRISSKITGIETKSDAHLSTVTQPYVFVGVWMRLGL